MARGIIVDTLQEHQCAGTQHFADLKDAATLAGLALCFALNLGIDLSCDRQLKIAKRFRLTKTEQ